MSNAAMAVGEHKTGPHFPEIVPSLLPQADVGGTPLELKSSLTCMITYILLPLRVLRPAGLRKACQGLLPPSFSLPALTVCLLTSCSLQHLCHPITSPLLSLGLPLLCIPTPLSHSFLARLPHSNPFPTQQKPCIHLALT